MLLNSEKTETEVSEQNSESKETHTNRVKWFLKKVQRQDRRVFLVGAVELLDIHVPKKGT